MNFPPSVNYLGGCGDRQLVDIFTPAREPALIPVNPARCSARV
jgi:hypothetical protein